MIKKFRIRAIVFFPAGILLCLAVYHSIFYTNIFVDVLRKINYFILNNFSGLFNIVAMLAIIGCIIAYFAPIGNVRIGGDDAKPVFSRLKSFYITLCTTIAGGLVFWSTVEPIYHLSDPPIMLGLKAFSAQTIKFTMETMFLHWSFNVYAIYAMPAIVFAFAYFNMKKPFSVLSQFAPIFPNISKYKVFHLIDSVCLLALSTGMVASFMTGTLNISGAVSSMYGIKSNSILWMFIIFITLLCFTFSSITGLNKGIRILSEINIVVYWMMLIAMILLGPLRYSLNLGVEALGGYLSGFFEKSLLTGESANDTWSRNWTTFYWASWLGWAPVSGCFLGRLAYGHRVKDIILYSLVYPSLFSIVWITLFSGSAIYFQITGQLDLVNLILSGQSELIPYKVLQALPFGNILVPSFLLITFISFVTAADSTTNAMASLSSKGITIDEQEATIFNKIFWGVGISVISFIMLKFTNIEGIKMFANLSGVLSLFLVFLVFISLLFIAWNYKKFSIYN